MPYCYAKFFNIVDFALVGGYAV